MARYRGPRHKIARRFGENIWGTRSASLQRRLTVRPGGRPPPRRRSEYALALEEKQKARYTYGVMEAQFRRYIERARRAGADAGEVLLRLLESRLDNVVYRLGLALTRPMARQLVSHGHVRVDGRRVTIPSYQVSPGQTVELAEEARLIPDVQQALADPRVVPEWLRRVDAGGIVVRPPARADVLPPLRDDLILQFYSR